MNNHVLNRLSKEILLSSIEVHQNLGPGLLESIYELCLLKELHSKNIRVENQVFLPVLYKGEDLRKDFRIDLLVEREIIVEIKAVDTIISVHEAQIISYLKLADKKLGFLVNFNVPKLKMGFRRFVNNF